MRWSSAGDLEAVLLVSYPLDARCQWVEDAEVKIVRRYGPEDFPHRIEAGHQRVREVVRQVPLLRLIEWDGRVMLGEFDFDGTSAGVAHLTRDCRPVSEGKTGVGGRVDTVTRISEHGSFVSFPWDDHSQAPTVRPQPTGQLALIIDGERLVAGTWYQRGDWVSSVAHGQFFTTITSRSVPLGPGELCAVDDLEPLLDESRRSLQDWAASPQ